MNTLVPYNKYNKVSKYNRNKYNRKRYNRYNNKRIVKPTVNGIVRQPVHYFTEFVRKNTITGAIGTTSTLGTIHFKLNDLSDYARFTAMYEFFKINAVQINLVPASNVTNYQSVADFDQSAHSNRCFTVFDYQDKNNPTSVDDLRRYNNCKYTPNNMVHQRYLHPKVNVTIDEDGPGVANYALAVMPKNPWISTDNNACEWFGVKYAIEHATLTVATGLYIVECKYYLSFKNKK